MEWWESISIGSLTFVCTPTQHWCQRYPLDFNNALWCGWVVESPKYKYYFAGDTGYHKKLFQLIGQKYGPFDLASIPIGAYEPRYITEFESVNPEEAVEVHCDIQSRVSIGINWGTFELTNEYYLEPPQELEKQMYNNGLEPKTFFNLQIGETWIVGEDRDYDPPFMEREKRGTPRLNYDRPNGDLSGFTTVATLQDPLSMVDALCQDIKTENQVKKIECSHPRRISPDGPSSHNNHIDLATITVMEPTVPSKRSMARDAQWSHKTQEDSALVVKPTGRYKPRSMTIQEAFKAPWPHNNQEDSAIGMKPTGRSKPKRSLSPDAPLQRNNQDSDSGIKPTGSLARD
ncbi:uncharacterized protein LOC128244128 [Mya arenaria]|uniref:uncharacterized protein LOC128244128 n=1 Tax=Mya arenaria TaxID=6604 RepID=UPI0022E33616|nr:uncharacterized protein LOC128244128 [Mya arenaria]